MRTTKEKKTHYLCRENRRVVAVPEPEDDHPEEERGSEEITCKVFLHPFLSLFLPRCEIGTHTLGKGCFESLCVAIENAADFFGRASFDAHPSATFTSNSLGDFFSVVKTTTLSLSITNFISSIGIPQQKTRLLPTAWIEQKEQPHCNGSAKVMRVEFQQNKNKNRLQEFEPDAKNDDDDE